MYEVIGHEKLREHLKGVEAPFAVIGPPGVGKKGIVYEWVGDREFDAYPILTASHVKMVAKDAYSAKDLTVLLDGDTVQTWDPLLKPIEEGYLRPVIYATGIPKTVGSRMSVFGAGYLDEQQVLQILAKSFPTYGPRPWIAKALMGHFSHFNHVYAATEVFEEINSCLAGRTFPQALKEQPVAVYYCLRLASAAKIDVANLPWSKAALESFPREVAWEILRGPVSVDKHEARNVMNVFFAGVTGGRLG